MAFSTQLSEITVYFSSFTAVETNQNPDYIIDDDTHENTGLIVRKIYIKETD